MVHHVQPHRSTSPIPERLPGCSRASGHNCHGMYPPEVRWDTQRPPAPALISPPARNSPKTAAAPALHHSCPVRPTASGVHVATFPPRSFPGSGKEVHQPPRVLSFRLSTVLACPFGTGRSPLSFIQTITCTLLAHHRSRLHRHKSPSPHQHTVAFSLTIPPFVLGIAQSGHPRRLVLSRLRLRSPQSHHSLFHFQTPYHSTRAPPDTIEPPVRKPRQFIPGSALGEVGCGMAPVW